MMQKAFLILFFFVCVYANLENNYVTPDSKATALFIAPPARKVGVKWISLF